MFVVRLPEIEVLHLSQGIVYTFQLTRKRAIYIRHNGLTLSWKWAFCKKRQLYCPFLAEQSGKPGADSDDCIVFEPETFLWKCTGRVVRHPAFRPSHGTSDGKEGSSPTEDIATEMRFSALRLPSLLFFAGRLARNRVGAHLTFCFLYEAVVINKRDFII